MYTDEVIEYNRLYREKSEGIVVRNAATIGSLRKVTVSQSERVEKLEQRIEKLWDTVIGHAEHIEKLEAVLQQWLAVDEKPTAIPLFGFDFWGKATADYNPNMGMDGNDTP